jgi:hypothetical protein
MSMTQPDAMNAATLLKALAEEKAFTSQPASFSARAMRRRGAEPRATRYTRGRWGTVFVLAVRGRPGASREHAWQG